MGYIKRIRIKEREIAVKTVSFADIFGVDFTGAITPQKIIRLCISEDDFKYLSTIGFEPTEMHLYTQLLEAVIEVNPAMFNNPLLKAQSEQKSTEMNGDGSSGQPKILGGVPKT